MKLANGANRIKDDVFTEQPFSRVKKPCLKEWKPRHFLW